jgi:hypothetical protein
MMRFHDRPLFVDTCHSTFGRGSPFAEAVNLARLPAATIALLGCDAITGAL